MLPAATAALALLAGDPGPELTLIHGDEHLATWLDVASVRRDGDRVRSRVLRIREPDQVFWVISETDCAAHTRAQIDVVNQQPGMAPPPLDGEARWFTAYKPYYRLERAIHAAVCDGARPYAWAAPARGVDAAIARLDEARNRAVADRPLELIRAGGDGRFVMFLDRATLDGGGPQWEARSFQVTAEGFEVGGEGFVGGWSYWEFDCDSWNRYADLRAFASVREDGTVGPRTPSDLERGQTVSPGSGEEGLLDIACAEDVWERDVITSLDEAVRVGREALEE